MSCLNSSLPAGTLRPWSGSGAAGRVMVEHVQRWPGPDYSPMGTKTETRPMCETHYVKIPHTPVSVRFDELRSYVLPGLSIYKELAGRKLNGRYVWDRRPPNTALDLPAKVVTHDSPGQGTAHAPSTIEHWWRCRILKLKPRVNRKIAWNTR